MPDYPAYKTPFKSMVCASFGSWLENHKHNIKGFDYFLGGSYRFGYNIRQSDIDYFVWCEDPHSFIQILKDNDFQEVQNKSRYENTITLTLNDLIHVGVFNIKEVYEIEKRRNEEIFQMLKSNKELKAFVKLLKILSEARSDKKDQFVYSGSRLFDMIYTVFEDPEKI